MIDSDFLAAQLKDGSIAAERIPEQSDRFDALSDLDLLRTVIKAIEAPRLGLHTFDERSFALHAPLELLARYALLPWVRPERRQLARLQLVATAAMYQTIGQPGAPPSPWRPESMTEAWSKLTDAFDRGDRPEVERYADCIAERATPETVIALLGDRVVKRLGAAVHTPIFLALLCWVGPGPARLAMPKLREFLGALSTEPVVDWQRAGAPRAADVIPFRDIRLGRVRHLAPPGEQGIVPLVKQAAENGVLDVHLGAVASLQRRDASEYDAAFAILMRLAAASMLQETVKPARYGWTHCLTIPQAIWSMSACLESRDGALSLATAVVESFRSAYGSDDFRPDWVPAPTSLSLRDALNSSPEAAASAAFHAPDTMRAEIETELATQAAIRNDTHLVKYTLTCLDLVAMDPAYASLYLAAAAYLLAIWIHDTPEESLYANLPNGRI